MDNDDQLEFEREKWRDERLLREQELELKKKETELKEKESKRSVLTSPVAVALLGVTAAIFTSAGANLTQTWVASRTNSAQVELEKTKAEHARISEVLKTDKAAKNLQFLVETELIENPLREKVRNQLEAMSSASEQRIDPAFRDIRYAIVQAIGDPAQKAVLVDDAYQAVYEHAHVIWIRNLLTIFMLPTDQTRPNREAIRYQEAHFTTDQRLHNEDELKKLFPPPEGKFPPHGGLASLWLSDPGNWRWIGWRIWHCRFFNKVHLQEFEKGTAIGPLLVQPNQRFGQIAIIPTGGPWVSRMTPVQAPECGDVGAQFPKG
jgi:hypothetical protein